MDCLVRRATIADLERLVGFTAAEATEAEGINMSEAKIRQGVLTALKDEAVAMYWVLEDGRDVIGQVSVVREWSDWNAGYYWWIQSMYLEPQHRGKGLMKLLLRAVQDSAREHRALELRLYVHKGNAPAIKAYLKAGFTESDYRIMAMGLTA